MSWLLANGQRASPNLFMQVGQQLARNNPSDAIAYAPQIPAAAREQWMQGVAQGYAQSDPQGAIDWLEQFRGEPWYGRAASTLAMEVAQRDPAAAARLVDGLDTERMGQQAQSLVYQIANTWAGREPAAAAAWALDRPTEQQRVQAVSSVVRVWSVQDVDGARQWTLRLPQGSMRDNALTALLTTTAQRTPGTIDPRSLNGFSSEATRQRAVMQVVNTLAYQDPAKARTVIDGYLTDPALRAQAESVLDAARNNPRSRSPGFAIELGTTR
jgi:hypothetical protein